MTSFSDKESAHSRKTAIPLQKKLLVTFLPISLLSIMIAGAVSGMLTYRRTAQQAELRLNNLATITAELTAKDLSGKMTILSTIAANPLVLDAAQDGAKQAEADRLQTLPIANLETQFSQTKLLKPNSRLNEYLQNVALKSGFAELFFTERNGLNIAYNRPTSDFVQQDEAWWQKGKQLRQWIGQPKFDQSSQTVTIELISAIFEPTSRQFLGVLKGGYDAVNLAYLKNELQNLQLRGAEQLQILAGGDHIRAIATITSQGVSSSQDVVGEGTIAEQALRLRKSPAFEVAPESTQIQLISWSHADRRYTLVTIPGTDWMAVASVTIDQIQASGRQMAIMFSLFFLGLGGLTTWIIVRFSRTLSAPLKNLALMVQQATEKADFTMQAPVSTEDDELRLLALSFNRLLQRVQELLREQSEIQTQLELVNQTLEKKVHDRTQELEAYSQTLEQRVGDRTQELQEKTLCLEQTLHQLQQTQLQMVQAEKMSSLGQLVAGIAHEINNPVNFIHGNLSHTVNYIQDLLELLNLYQTEFPHHSQKIADKIVHTDLDFIKEDLPNLLSSMRLGTDRIHDIVKSLRVFSRLDESEIKPIDIHQGIDSTLMILHHRLKATPDRAEITVIKEYGDIPLVECYAGQLNQVFMNILVNAIDALDEVNSQRNLQVEKDAPSRIVIQTSVVDVDWVKIVIMDNGPGIPQPIQQRIFDPFFTTKPVGKGTGMGMSISYQIITEKHHGKLEYVATSEQGAQFIIQIPIHRASIPPLQDELTHFSAS